MKKVFLLLAVSTAIITACETTTNKTEGTEGAKTDTTMVEDKEERNKKVVMASMEAMIAKNVDEAFKDVAPDAVDYNDGSMPAIKGKDSIMNMVKQWVNAFPDNKGQDIKYVADGDWVMVWGEWSGTFKNDFMGMKATNKSYKLKDVDIFKLNDAGQITEHHNIQSPNTMMGQVGMTPPKK
ncbi:ester cyclase [Niastella caeni]|uniref:Ester cyclase n=1 Tax=Niastella caeni TaxID=2569763 RepID=A0A4S8HZW6_9BACT|nr:ester cyclase [Niastella caeni]THU41363.1 ester cyclase [Niastella caeni]